jgi:hypothetical protein
VTAYFRVTVEDLETGDKQVIEVAEGDYVINTFDPCYLGTMQRYGGDTVQVFIKNHRPAAGARHPEAA